MHCADNIYLGYAVTEPERRVSTTTGAPIARFRMSLDETRRANDDGSHGRTDCLTVLVTGRGVDQVLARLSKGTYVAVWGKFEIQCYHGNVEVVVFAHRVFTSLTHPASAPAVARPTAVA